MTHFKLRSSDLHTGYLGITFLFPVTITSSESQFSLQENTVHRRQLKPQVRGRWSELTSILWSCDRPRALLFQIDPGTCHQLHHSLREQELHLACRTRYRALSNATSGNPRMCLGWCWLLPIVRFFSSYLSAPSSIASMLTSGNLDTGNRVVKWHSEL